MNTTYLCRVHTYSIAQALSLRSTAAPREQPLRVVSVVGTRPEAIKMAPIVLEMGARPGFAHRLIASGQQDTLFDDAVCSLGLSVDDHLGQNPGGGDANVQRDTIKQAINLALSARKTDIMLVQGDTNTALAAAQAAKSCGVMVGHVEAGLRSFDLTRPFPEEGNRIAIAKIATLHFAPSASACANLLAEGISHGVMITGNPGIDALMKLEPTAPRSDAKHILVTCHRRENFGEPLARICAALLAIAEAHEVHINVPVHPNPMAGSTIIRHLGNHPKINLCRPLPYAAVIDHIRRSHFVISDSGGLQEECAALGVPLLILREETERPEVIESGNARLVGSNIHHIVIEAARLINDPLHRERMSRPSFPYGKGDAAVKIVDAISDHFGI
jgi:UDP-N-acetylglucosamine 2-epimerase (non-hydrolysing)